jgi:hypothetical protein
MKCTSHFSLIPDKNMQWDEVISEIKSEIRSWLCRITRQRLRSTCKDEFALALPPFEVDPRELVRVERGAPILDSICGLGNVPCHQHRRDVARFGDFIWYTSLSSRSNQVGLNDSDSSHPLLDCILADMHAAALRGHGLVALKWYMKTESLGNERLVMGLFQLELLEEALIIGNNYFALIYYLNTFCQRRPTNAFMEMALRYNKIDSLHALRNYDGGFYSPMALGVMTNVSNTMHSLTLKWSLEQDAKFIEPGMLRRLASMIIEMAVEESHLGVSLSAEMRFWCARNMQSSLMYLIDDSRKVMGDLALFENAIRSGDRLNLIRLLLSWNNQQQVDLNELQGRYFGRFRKDYVQACFAMTKELLASTRITIKHRFVRHCHQNCLAGPTDLTGNGRGNDSATIGS